MNPDEPTAPDDLFADWLVACDAALAAGAIPPNPPSTDEDEFPPELRDRMQRGLQGLRLLDCLRLRQLDANENIRRDSPETPTETDQDESATAVALPWTKLGRFQLRRELGRG